MKSISFKNFRRFKEFPDFKYGDITILVGANNAGKSTLAKAMDFIVNGLQTVGLKYDNTMKGILCASVKPYFNIQSQGEYGRIRNNSHDGNIKFNLQLGDWIEDRNNWRFELYLEFEKMEESDSCLEINRMVLKDNELLLQFELNPDDALLRWVDCDTKIQLSDDEGEIEVKKIFDEEISSRGIGTENIDAFIMFNRAKLRAFAPDEMDDEWYFYHKNAYELNRNHRHAIMHSTYSNIGFNSSAFNTKNGFSYDDMHYDRDFQNQFSSLLMSSFEKIGFGDLWKVNAKNNRYAELGYLRTRIKESLLDFEREIKKLSNLQLPIHSLKRTITYSDSHPLHSLIRKFKQVETSEVIRNYHSYGEYIMGTLSQDTHADILKKYLSEFEIATDYRIKSIGGVVYTFEILDKNGKWVHLTDIGTGPIRLIEIILFLLTSNHSATVFIEEPEQNLHPKLQSKLADFFLKVRNELGIKIIVETHSEYLVRRSQVLVAEMNLSEEDLDIKNPFKVYYFPEEGVPYDMKYTTSGRFEKNFGEGFFDEASVSALTLSRLERRKKDDWN